MINVLIACETSGVMREAFRERGFDAWSCDVLPADDGSPHHIQADILEFLDFGGWQFDLMIAHPPCTDLSVSGARWFKEKQADGRQAASIKFFMALANAEIPRIVIENPVGIMSTQWRKPDQVIQPWHFGEPAFKATCLWLKGVPPLQPTKVLTPPAQKGSARHKQWSAIHMAPPGPDRWKIRSKTFPGIADAAATQWGNHLNTYGRF